jgi:hypothetical protein
LKIFRKSSICLLVEYVLVPWYGNTMVPWYTCPLCTTYQVRTMAIPLVASELPVCHTYDRIAVRS